MGMQTATIALRDEGQEEDPLRVLVLGWIADQTSVETRRAYAREIAAWLQWCAERGTEPLAASRADGSTWARRLEAQGLTAATISRKLAAASSWYNWLAEQEHVDSNPLARVKRPKVDWATSMTPALTKEQAVALLAAADNARGDQRLCWSALIATLLYSGARRGEAIGADIEDLGMSGGHKVLIVTRKGGKRQQLVLTAPVTTRLEDYLASRPDMEHLPARPGEPGAPRPRRVLFAASTGARLRPRDVHRLVKRLAKAAGLPPELAIRVGPHALRHTAITFALATGAPLHDVQDMAGHVKADTTQRYNHARHRLERSPAYAIAAYLASAEEES